MYTNSIFSDKFYSVDFCRYQGFLENILRYCILQSHQTTESNGYIDNVYIYIDNRHICRAFSDPRLLYKINILLYV